MDPICLGLTSPGILDALSENQIKSLGATGHVGVLHSYPEESL